VYRSPLRLFSFVELHSGVYFRSALDAESRMVDGDYVRPDRHVQQQLNLNSQFQDSILEDTPLLRDKD